MRRRMLSVAAVWVMIGLVAATGCAEPGGPETPAEGGADPEATADGVVPLAKVDGWRSGLAPPGGPFAVLEIAYDRDTAEQAWQDNVPGDLPAGSGMPEEPAIYGDLTEVDFDRQVIVVWSSGQSGSCPGWLADVATGEDGAVTVQQRDTAELRQETEGTVLVCTSDYRPYRMVLAVDADRLPEVADLPTEDVHGVPDGRVASYPEG